MTFAVSLLLSKTVLKGVPSSFTLELPPYRRPQIGRVIVRSVFDRTLFVLCRAAAVAAPAGLIIWIMANVTVGGNTLLAHCSGFLDPFGRLLGMDGVILLAFILGFPANEIVIPIIIMSYMSIGTIAEFEDLLSLKQLLIENGWTWITAVSTMLFSLFHWPCSTTCLTIGKETGSLKWTAVSFALPTVVGMAVCFLFANTAKFCMKIPAKPIRFTRIFSIKVFFAFISIMLRISSGVKVLLRLNLARYSILPFVPRIGDMAIPPKTGCFRRRIHDRQQDSGKVAGIAQHPVFSDLMPRRLKLRFYKADTNPLRL